MSKPPRPRCVICGKRAPYLVSELKTEANPSTGDEAVEAPRPMCREHAQQARPDALIPRPLLAHQLAGRPASGRSKTKLPEAYLAKAFFFLLADAILWSNEAADPSVLALVGALVTAVIGLSLLWRAWVVRVRERLELHRQATEPDRPTDG